LLKARRRLTKLRSLPYLNKQLNEILSLVRKHSYTRDTTRHTTYDRVASPGCRGPADSYFPCLLPSDVLSTTTPKPSTLHSRDCGSPSGCSSPLRIRCEHRVLPFRHSNPATESILRHDNPRESELERFRPTVFRRFSDRCERDMDDSTD